MPKKSLKTPNDYPLFGYRVLPQTKENLTAQLETVLKKLNSNRPENSKPLKKNDVFVNALEHGLRFLESKKKDGKDKHERSQ